MIWKVYFFCQKFWKEQEKNNFVQFQTISGEILHKLACITSLVSCSANSFITAVVKSCNNYHKLNQVILYH